MNSYHKCKYKDECPSYQRDNIKCQFAMKLCLHRIGIEEMERLTDVHLSPSGIEGCLDNLQDESKIVREVIIESMLEMREGE